MAKQLQKLRKEVKQQRSLLPDEEVANNSRDIAARFWRLPSTQRINNLAVYLSVNGEVDCQDIIQEGWSRKKRIFAPVLSGKRLVFAPLKPGTKLLPNSYGILEPVYQKQDLVDPRRLDAAVFPLLLFDDKLNRVGMGAGYYDRTFAFSKQRHKLRHPLLIGVAHSFQRVRELAPAPWDVQLHLAITEKECFGSY